MNQPLPEEERLARARAQRQAWSDAHPDYYRQHYAQNREHDLELKRLRRAETKTANQQRQKAVERAAAWAKANPDARREAREKYKANNPEAYRASQRAYNERNKEKIRARKQARESAIDPETLRAARRQSNAGRGARNDAWTPSQEQRDRYNTEALAKKKLDRRLQRAGLPPRKVRRTLVSERRANRAASEQFFNTTQKQRNEMLRRIRDGSAETGSVAPELINEWRVLTAKIRERSRFREALPGKVQKYLEKHGTQLREEIALDSRARQLRGEPPLSEGIELRRRAVDAVVKAAPTIFGAQPVPRDLDPELQRIIDVNRRNFPTSAVEIPRPAAGRPSEGRKYRPSQLKNSNETALER